MEKKTNPQFVIKETSDEKFHFVLIARNGRTILSSETYSSKQGAERGINSVLHNASDHKRFECKKSVDKQHFFVLTGGNGETIGVSEMYQTKAGMRNGIKSISVNSVIIKHKTSKLL